MNEIERLRAILEQVKTVRAEQKAFFGGDRSAARVGSSKREERRLDTMIERHEQAVEAERQGRLL